MTATDELRRLLDERGVKWTRSCYSGMRYLENTMWPIVSRTLIKFTEYSDGQTKLIIENATPEQAIAATLGSGACKPTEEDCCPICGEDLVKCNVGIGELGGAVELDPPIYHNYCPNCGAKVVRQ